MTSRPYRSARMGGARIEMRSGDDGVLYVANAQPLGPYPRSVMDRLVHWAETTPDTVFLAERSGGGWRSMTYADVLRAVRSLGTMLLERGLSAERPLMILSGNSLDHALIGYAAMYAGIPYAPISPAYSLLDRSFAKLRHIVGLVDPGLVYAEDGAEFSAAIAACVAPGIPLVTSRNALEGRETLDFSAQLARRPEAAVERANAAITGDTVAKVLFTSGSTGMPKGVITTHRMLSANQEMIRTALAFLADEPPVLVDWMPWNHTAGGNHNLGIALYNGGTFHIDQGKPTPDAFATTIENLKLVSPTLYFSVPKAYELLVEALGGDGGLGASFFRRLRLMQYAGAGLSQHIWDGLDKAAFAAAGEYITMVSGYGSTETAPFAFTTTWPAEQAGQIGLPAAGLAVKLVPNGQKLEVRLRGPNVTPGYWRDEARTAEAFDSEGYYRIGDAMRFVDEADPSRGFSFDGRVGDDFKLSSGTWVNVAAVRSGLIGACAPLARDAVLTGLDRNHIGALIFPDLAACRALAGEGMTNEEVVAHPRVREAFGQRLDAYARRATGSSNHVARAVLLAMPPSLAAGEITDKGSLNPHAVVAARAGDHAALYAEPVPEFVFNCTRTPRS